MSREREFYAANVDAMVGRRLVHHAALAVRVAQTASRAYPDLEHDAKRPRQKPGRKPKAATATEA